MRKLLLLGVITVLSGCASLSQEECLTGDWYGIGYSDGTRGKVESELAEHQEACAEYQIRVDLTAYMAGRTQGLKQYCQPDNGYWLGLEGASYHYVCPESEQAAFLERYRAGKAIYEHKQEVRRLERELQRLRNQQTQLEDQIKSTEARLVAEGLSSGERQSLLNQLRDLETQRPQRLFDYQHLSSQLHFQRLQLLQLQQE